MDRIQQAKIKNEKEATETIFNLRRQLADQAVAAEHAKRAQLAAEESLRRVIGEDCVPRSASHVIVVASGTQPSTPTTSPTKTPRGRPAKGSKKKETAAKKAAELAEAQRLLEEAVKKNNLEEK